MRALSDGKGEMVSDREQDKEVGINPDFGRWKRETRLNDKEGRSAWKQGL